MAQMKVLFLDESGDHSLKKIDDQYPVFCLAGVIIDEEVYSNTVKPQLDALKLRYWKSTDVVFHSREIRKVLPPFDNLLNAKVRSDFYADLDSFFAASKITVLASVILKKKLRVQYSDPINPYEISMIFLMERFLYHLEETGDQGYITVESRDSKSNKDLFEEYSNILANGSGSRYKIEPSRFQNRIHKIEFVTKKQNENGHQIADLIAYPIANKILHPERNNPAYSILKPKFRNKDGKIEGYGLKVFP
jgi:Protein of unknown function (DUF3800)